MSELLHALSWHSLSAGSPPDSFSQTLLFHCSSYLLYLAFPCMMFASNGSLFSSILFVSRIRCIFGVWGSKIGSMCSFVLLRIFGCVGLSLGWVFLGLSVGMWTILACGLAEYWCYRDRKMKILVYFIIGTDWKIRNYLNVMLAFIIPFVGKYAPSTRTNYARFHLWPSIELMSHPHMSTLSPLDSCSHHFAPLSPNMCPISIPCLPFLLILIYQQVWQLRLQCRYEN